MRNKLIVLALVIASVMALNATAANQKATLINSLGDKVVVAVGSMEAQMYFARGYVLMGADMATKVEKVCDCDELGAAGGNFTSRQFFRGGATTGGSYYATTSTATTYTLGAKELTVDRSYIAWTPNVDITVKISATSTLPMIPRIGDTATIYVRNASTTSGTITFDDDNATNVDMQYPEGTGGDLVLDEEQFAAITFVRKTATTIAVLFDEYIED